MVDEKAKTKFENIALLYKDVDDLKYSYCRKSFRVMLTPNNEMIMVNVLTDSDKNVIFTAEKNSIVGTNAMFICLITMLKDNGIADAGVMKVSEYLNL